MGNAYLAIVNGVGSFNKLVVLKVLKPEFAEDQEFLAMFQDEARIAANLNHPNVVQTHEFGVQDGHFFIAMDFVDGQPLRVVRKRLQEQGALSLGIHLRIIGDVLEGLQYAHDLTDHDGSPLHLVHRDVSPHNVMVSYDGHAKLLDFGIAKAQGSSHQTTTGVLKGKVGYMAPEQARCEQLDARADIFPVGVLVWEAIVGGRMWANLTDVQVLAQLVRKEIPQVPEVIDGKPVPASLRAIVAKATAADREDRYGSAREFYVDLESYLETLPRAETSARALADVLAAHFGSEREKRRRVVDEAVRQVRAAGSTAEYPALLGLTGSGPSTGGTGSMPGVSPISAHGASQVSQASHVSQMVNLQQLSSNSSRPSQPTFTPVEGSSSSTFTPSTSAPFMGPTGTGQYSSHTGPSIALPAPPPAPSVGLRIAMVAGAVAVILGGLAVFALRSKGEGPSAGPATVTTAVVASPSEVRLELLVASGSTRATVTLDGKEVATGGEIRVTRDTAEHTLKARADGYKEHVETLKLDRDQRISMTLEPDPASAHPSVTTPVAAGNPAGGHRPPTTGNGKPNVAPPPATASAVTPPPTASAPATPPTSTGPKRPDRPIIEVLK
jgi:serine/threonine-protein kinase